jgi:CheY-like chemotaxis protein
MLNNEVLVQSWSNGPKNIRVLMADPDEFLQIVYREPLTWEGFEVTTAFSGLECVARLRKRIPDVLVLEPQLPWGGGEGVLAMMGEVPNLAILPVMILTSCRDPYVLDRVARFPISDYQVKPLAPDRLAERLHTLLDHPGMRFTLAEQNGRLECLIARRTGGRIQNLHVETDNGRVIVHGCSDSYYVRQLVLAAVLEAFQASESKPGNIELEIEVSGG